MKNVNIFYSCEKILYIFTISIDIHVGNNHNEFIIIIVILISKKG